VVGLFGGLAHVIVYADDELVTDLGGNWQGVPAREAMTDASLRDVLDAMDETLWSGRCRSVLVSGRGLVWVVPREDGVAMCW
jgi:hypothetical protein